MRISDWSSDVCSSDLKRRSGFPAWPPGEREQAQRIDERIAQIIDRIRHERARARRQSATKFDREHERVDHQDCDQHAALIVPAGKGQIGRGSCWESVCQEEKNWVGAL